MCDLDGGCRKSATTQDALFGITLAPSHAQGRTGHLAPVFSSHAIGAQDVADVVLQEKP